ncbi:hypothetical protein BBJ28_00018992 [Nothophytophthora sp. Chile5]|nr:hypothetical protein BBJ28_00018992 [Nothophytophthora sp. Chile5]
MPPKKGGGGASKKSVEKKKEKLVEDKTFGLKNKNKSKNVQKYIQEVTKQVKGGNTRADRLQELERNKKKQAKADQESIKSLFAAAITQPKVGERSRKPPATRTAVVFITVCLLLIVRAQVPPGADPKSFLCAFFKAGVCTKGARCKFSHDLNVGKKAAKIDLYSDNRGEKEEGSTRLFCACCLYRYRHALPPGYVFKSRKDRELERSNKVVEISIEEIIEQQRAKLGPSGGTPVTAESLAKWKAEKLAKKKVEEEKRRKEEAKKSGGRGLSTFLCWIRGGLLSLVRIGWSLLLICGRSVLLVCFPVSGRALFSYDPTLFHDDADADDERYSVHSEEEYEDDDDDEVEEKPAPAVDAAAAVMDKSLYLQDVDDLDSLKK